MAQPRRQESVPKLTLGRRMRMAREQSGLKMEDLANQIEVSRNTVMKWENDWNHHSPKAPPPKTLFLKAWALACGVPYEWLIGDHGDDDSPISRPAGSPPANKPPLKPTSSRKPNHRYREYARSVA